MRFVVAVLAVLALAGCGASKKLYGIDHDTKVIRVPLRHGPITCIHFTYSASCDWESWHRKYGYPVTP
jgi:hypothetical protein